MKWATKLTNTRLAIFFNKKVSVRVFSERKSIENKPFLLKFVFPKQQLKNG
jgi:hypothetical protein